MQSKFIALLGGAALSLGLVTAASAADMRVKAAPMPAPVPVFSWTGFYIGANVGGAWGESRTDSSLVNTGGGQQYIPSVVADINAQRFQTVTASGFTGGGQAGYNWQAQNFVFGVEADINAFNLSGTTTTSAFFTGFPGGAGSTPPTYTNSFSTTWLATIRGRAGFAVDRAFFYGTAGAAFTDLSYRHTFAEGVFPGSSLGVQASTASATKTGWVVGAGLEYAMTGNWTVKAEYLYLDFGSISSTAPVVFPGGPGTSVFSHTADLTAQIGRVGLNYKWGGPVVARY